jgi:hypothetical protein
MRGWAAQIQTRLAAITMSSGIKTKLLNRRHVKEFALAVAQSRFHKFTRVSGQFFLKSEAHLKEFIRSYVSRLPSKGKTIN